MWPSSAIWRYLQASIHSAYLVAIPTIAATHIQNKAPAPPATTAVATPTILPVPMVADNDVQRAAKLETSPSLPFFSFLNIYLNASISLWNCNPLKRMVKKMPVTRIITIRGTPHTKSSIATKRLLIVSNIIFSFCLIRRCIVLLVYVRGEILPDRILQTKKS